MIKAIIAFDIDGTWDLNPVAFRDVFLHFKRHGFECIIVTGADQPAEKLNRLMIPDETTIIILKDKILKKEAARRAGFNVAVWIDNEPGFIEECRVLKDNLD